ncbi:MAG: transcription antitermination factor NusB [Candidatus Edwardsbacteria bacterium RIFOXYD12_FULL_50_11]|jgi:N utilization substance protein B|uniref:Transcription antitermination protein NusB n=1 Tax=Candidatus Edwardsbacteria bacterium GWF2_54_11 TaxID=1817851 RepID=A0A1F5REU1_9BACT|nr:MAG: transcription antitermination factor NusB [Candidatus Edwardsbacteria bacterium RifOxyC12_full_54_24]OGF07941.1 MAG: transcription antitermination factor NusB [Candidatus Edwardsbacteria bacterium RifOxyA12_full_54_48]OGF10189.1 MAG: transcription antitermination factor NusB [Candidatus Edwardsbacteria bacterium GWE2_54_12]OGF12990.1 MAG: transcription antitermination factor NusB [Candidatus Edwardsbacteria bacterium GWF2_54_11]OGF15101.1 MAG: transcription antitermination factor NusB [
MGSRRKSRELALQALYQVDLTGDLAEKALYDLKHRNPEDPEMVEFSGVLVNAVITNLDSIDRVIIKAAQNWTMDRMALIDRNIIRLGVAQLQHLEEQVPPKVAIDESIELAKKFGDEESGRFINGVLDKIFKDMEKKER